MIFLHLQIVVAFLWIYGIIITTAYSSNLTAFLTVKRLPRAFDTIRGIRESGLQLGGQGPAFDAISESQGNKDLEVSKKPPWLSHLTPYIIACIAESSN